MTDNTNEQPDQDMKHLKCLDCGNEWMGEWSFDGKCPKCGRGFTLPEPSPEAMKAAEHVWGWLEEHFRLADILQNAPNGKDEILKIIDAKFADLRDMLEALTTFGWTVSKTFYGSGSIGWTWRTDQREIHYAEGPHDQLPPWPDSARQALNEQRNARKEQRS
jgi:hypothetical protein